MEMLLIAVTGAIAIGGSLFLGIRVSERANRRKIATWKQLARKLGGSFESGDLGPLRASSALRIDCELDGIAVRTDLSTLGTASWHTRVQAQVAMPWTPSYRIKPAGLTTAVAKKAGLADIQLGGHTAFDAAFVVSATDPKAVAATWSAKARDRMAFLMSWTGESDGRVVCLTVLGVEASSVVLERAIGLVATLASEDVWLLTGLAEQIPGARYVPPRGLWNQRSSPMVEVTGRSGRLLVRPDVRENRKALCISMDLRRKLPFFRVRVGTNGAVRGAIPAGLTGREQPFALEALGACRIEADDDGARVYLESFGPDVGHRVEAAMALLTHMQGTVKGGAFR